MDLPANRAVVSTLTRNSGSKREESLTLVCSAGCGTHSQVPCILELMFIGPCCYSWVCGWKPGRECGVVTAWLEGGRTVEYMRRWLCKLEVPREE